MKVTRPLPVAVGMLLLVAIGYGVRLFWSPLNPTATRLEPEAGCDLRQAPCRAVLPDGAMLVFSIDPPEIPLMQPLRLRLSLEKSIYVPDLVDIVGLNMDMGLNRTRLLQSNPNAWEGETLLPLCSNTRMVWEARVTLLGGDAPMAVHFPFETLR